MAREDRLAAKPAALTFEQAAALPVSALTALQAVRDQANPLGTGVESLEPARSA